MESAAIGAKETASNASTSTGASLTEISSLYKTRLSNEPSLKTYSKNDQTGVITMLVNGEIVEGKQADDAYDAAFATLQDNFIRDGILDDSGDFVSAEAEYTAKALGMGDAVTKVQQSIIEQNQNQQQSSVSKNTAATVRSNPQAYINKVLQSNPTVTTATLRQALIAANVPQSEIYNLLGI